MFSQNRPQEHNFAAEPKVVPPRSKYRELSQEESQPMRDATNIMWDRRVVRGNTYAAIVTTSREAAEQLRLTQLKPISNKRKQLDTGEQEAVQGDASTPRAVEGRKHIQIYTDENVELLTDKPPKYEKDAQTEFIIDRPVNRLFMPEKTGEDRETQIWDGELFNFDYEVEPILQVLIGKTLEQGRMEVLEEEELRVMKDEQKRYDELRYAEIAEAQRMEAEERKRQEENEKRKKQHKLKKDQVVLTHKKLISRLLAKEYLRNVHQNGLAMLRELGTFQDHFDYEFNHSFLPWAVADVLHLHGFRAAASNTIKAVNKAIAEKLANVHKEAVHAEMERRRLAKEERERIERETQERRQKRAEARKKRDEELRRKLLQEKITEMLISKGEQRNQMFSQILSDMDAFGKEGMTVGLIGGIIGELIILLTTLDDFKKAAEDDPLLSLKSIQITKDTIQKIVDHIVNDTLKDGKLEVGVTGDIEAQLEAIDPELNLETIHTKPEKAKEILPLLKASINSFVLSVMQQKAEELGLKFDYFELIVNSIANIAISPEEKEKKLGRKFKLTKATMDYNEETKFEAVAVLMPNVDEMPYFNLVEAKGVKLSNKKNAAKKTSISMEESIKTEEAELINASPAEIDYDDMVTVFPLFNEETRVLVHQRPVSIVLRRDVLIFLSSLFKELDMKEIDVLKRVNAKAEGVEQAVANKFPKNLTVLVIDKI